MSKYWITGLLAICAMVWLVQQDFSPWKRFTPGFITPTSRKLAESARPQDRGYPPADRAASPSPGAAGNPAVQYSQNAPGSEGYPTPANVQQSVDQRLDVMKQFMENMLGGGGGHSSPPSPIDQLHQKLRFSLSQYQAATNESGARPALRTEISDLLAQQYDAHVQQYEQQVAELESRLAKLREHVQKRSDAKSRLVALKLELLLSQAEGMGWPEAFPNPPLGTGGSTGLPGIGLPGMVPANPPTQDPNWSQPPMPQPGASGPSLGTGEIPTFPGPNSQPTPIPIMPSGSDFMDTPPGGVAPLVQPGGGLPNDNMYLPPQSQPGIGTSLPPSGTTFELPVTDPGTNEPLGPNLTQPTLSDSNETGSGIDGPPIPLHPSDVSPVPTSGGGRPPVLQHEEPSQLQTEEALKAILLGFHNYVAALNDFPLFPRPEGSESLSWRVRILPYLGETELFNQFNLSEAWDSKNNRALLDRMPAAFGSGRRTRIRWIESEVRHIKDITDGTSNTIACIVGGQPVYWTENRPMSAFEAAEIFRTLPQGGGLTVGMYDGSVRTLTSDLGVGVFEAMLTPAGGEVIP